VKGIPPGFEDLLREETRAYAYLATLMPDGSPQVTPVWFSVEGEHILVNTAKGRIKDRNMRERSQVALVIADPRNPYRYLQVRGRVVGNRRDEQRRHFAALDQKYTGGPSRGTRPAHEVRVVHTIQPERISADK
jgi:PPOX class probable F420-dependent enzyme